LDLEAAAERAAEEAGGGAEAGERLLGDLGVVATRRGVDRDPHARDGEVGRALDLRDAEDAGGLHARVLHLARAEGGERLADRALDALLPAHPGVRSAMALVLVLPHRRDPVVARAVGMLVPRLGAREPVVAEERALAAHGEDLAEALVLHEAEDRRQR